MEVQNYFVKHNVVGGGQAFQQARQALFHLGIRTSYEQIAGESHDVNTSENAPAGGGVGKRMVFSLTSKAQSQLMTQNCNGLILERDTWRPLVIPPPTTQGSQVTSVVDAYIEQGLYDIFAIQDGTMVHLYFFAGEWKLSTNGSYDISNVYFTNTQFTYRKIFDEVLEGLGLGTFEEFTSKLDKGCSYSVIITHPDIHLYWKIRAERFQMSLVHRANLTTFECTRDWGCDIKVPVQLPIDFAKYGVKKLNLGLLKKICDIQLDGGVATMAPVVPAIPSGGEPVSTYAAAAAAGTEVAASKTEAKGEFDEALLRQTQFGVVLRSRDRTRTTKVSFISIESAKYNDIKHTLYENSIYREMTPESDRENYIILHAYLNRFYHPVFLRLFPQYVEIYESITARIKSLVAHLTRMYSNERTITTGGKQYKITSKHPELILTIKAKIDELMTVNIDDVNSDKLLNAYILNSGMTSVLYPYIFV